MRLEFNWDARKAEGNRKKHGIAFEDAMEVFADPLALSMLDPDPVPHEERWITIGVDRRGDLTLVVHTYRELAPQRAAIRIISARRPTRREARQYAEE